MSFEKWWDKYYSGIKISMIWKKEEIRDVWNAAIDEAVKSVNEKTTSHKRDVEGECDNNCDYVAAWETAIDAIKELKNEG